MKNGTMFVGLVVGGLSVGCGGVAKVEPVSLLEDLGRPLPTAQGGALLRVIESDTARFNVRLDKAGTLDGNYDGWCVDVANKIARLRTYPVELYSSYAKLPAKTVNKPGNFDQVNYLINTYAPGQTIELKAGVGPEAITLDDMQIAIWTLIDGDVGSTSDDWSQARIDGLVSEAEDKGEGFVPSCDQLVALVIRPLVNTDNTTANDVQVVIALAPLGEGDCG